MIPVRSWIVVRRYEYKASCEMKGLQEQLRRQEGEIKWKMRNKKKHFTFKTVRVVFIYWFSTNINGTMSNGYFIDLQWHLYLFPFPAGLFCHCLLMPLWFKQSIRVICNAIWWFCIDCHMALTWLRAPQAKRKCLRWNNRIPLDCFKSAVSSIL